ncbi:MAG: ArsR/SmtB family transcription factor [Candidatus Limnocylindrales bacterium]
MPSAAHIRTTIAAVVDQPEDLRELRIFHKALADVNRLRIVRRLAEASATVTELIEEVGLSQPLVSWHLSRLRAAGIVETRRVGRETRCSLRPAAWPEFAAREQAMLGLRADLASLADDRASAAIHGPAAAPVLEPAPEG